MTASSLGNLRLSDEKRREKNREGRYSYGFYCQIFGSAQVPGSPEEPVGPRGNRTREIPAIRNCSERPKSLPERRAGKRSLTVPHIERLKTVGWCLYGSVAAIGRRHEWQYAGRAESLCKG